MIGKQKSRLDTNQKELSIQGSLGVPAFYMCYISVMLVSLYFLIALGHNISCDFIVTGYRHRECIITTTCVVLLH